MSPETTRNPNLDIHSPSVAAAGLEAWRGNLGREEVCFPRGEDWWTGISPRDPACPGRRPDGSIGGMAPPDLATCTRAEVRQYFDNGWTLTELLFASLASEEAFYRPPYHGLRHPFIFYYTHPAALYINKSRVAGLIERPVNPFFEQLFETGVDEMSWDDLSKNEMEWPAISECREYRAKVYQLIAALIEEHEGLRAGHPRIGPDSPLWALFLGFEHERIHLETSSVLMRELPLALLRRPAEFPPCHPGARPAIPGKLAAWRDPVAGRDYPENPLREVGPGVATIGKDPEFPSFGWDNEYGSREVRVESFAASRHLITNGEFYEFVVAGGYREERFWTRDGWRWRNFRNVKWPTFWVPCGPQGAHQYLLRTTFELVDMPWDWPAVVNCHEARAFCAWRSETERRSVALRLATEAEHHRLRVEGGLLPAARLDAPEVAWRLFGESDLNLSLRYGSESPVTASDRAFTDVFGNVWHWVEDDFHPLEGFRIHPYYDDFSTPCFDGKHTMILGGSFISLGDEATGHARFHFRPHFFQHAGFRIVDPLRAGNDGAVVKLAEPGQGQDWNEAAMEAARLVAFASRAELLPDGVTVDSLHREHIVVRIRRCQSELQAGAAKALDVGCGPGAITCGLAPLYLEVIGADLSAPAVEAARRALESGETGLAPDDAKRVSYKQTDAGSLPAEWKDFDLVVASRLLTRLPSPKALLGRLSGARGLLRPGGLLVIADEFAWDPAATPRELWIEGTQAALSAALGPEFHCLEESETFAVERPRPGRIVLEVLRCFVYRRAQ